MARSLPSQTSGKSRTHAIIVFSLCVSIRHMAASLHNSETLSFCARQIKKMTFFTCCSAAGISHVKMCEL